MYELSTTVIPRLGALLLACFAVQVLRLVTGQLLSILGLMTCLAASLASWPSAESRAPGPAGPSAWHLADLGWKQGALHFVWLGPVGLGHHGQLRGSLGSGPLDASIFPQWQPFKTCFILFCFWVYGVVLQFQGQSCGQLGHFSWQHAQTSVDSVDQWLSSMDLMQCVDGVSGLSYQYLGFNLDWRWQHHHRVEGWSHLNITLAPGAGWPRAEELQWLAPSWHLSWRFAVFRPWFRQTWYMLDCFDVSWGSWLGKGGIQLGTLQNTQSLSILDPVAFPLWASEGSMAGRFVQLPSQGQVLLCAEPFQISAGMMGSGRLEELHRCTVWFQVPTNGQSYGHVNASRPHLGVNCAFWVNFWAAGPCLATAFWSLQLKPFAIILPLQLSSILWVLLMVAPVSTRGLEETSITAGILLDLWG